MYRQAPALAVLERGPYEDAPSPPEDLDGQTKRFAPHASVTNHDMERPVVPKGVVS